MVNGLYLGRSGFLAVAAREGLGGTIGTIEWNAATGDPAEAGPVDLDEDHGLGVIAAEANRQTNTGLRPFVHWLLVGNSYMRLFKMTFIARQVPATLANDLID
ncbi:hypothetical protein [Acidithrix sp. C25]|uniref:Uncharacterized protein n=2 Tax=Acidithrix ferrooxidans TaxID=1280514 RepID=A0A0D8HGU2_9ACTN|nr:hypothetical protein [Acidithrix sp. C25]KJF16296.1 hypothetical protein AXFE_28600 [Acidithrix ferrooxidans]